MYVKDRPDLTMILTMSYHTLGLSKTKLGTFPPLVLGGIIEDPNSDFVMA